MPCNVVIGYQHFQRTILLLHGEVTGTGIKGIHIGLKCKWAADAASQ